MTSTPSHHSESNTRRILDTVHTLNDAPDAWTHEPYEIMAETRWLIYDPNLATIVAEFHDEAAARNYVALRNIDRM